MQTTQRIICKLRNESSANYATNHLLIAQGYRCILRNVPEEEMSLKKDGYLPRLVDRKIERYLRIFGYT